MRRQIVTLCARDVRRPGGFGGQLVAGRTPGYSPGIRRVYARYTPEQVSESDRGGPHQRARRSNANGKLTATTDPQSCAPKPTTCLYYAIPAIAKLLSRSKHYVQKVYARGVRRDIYRG